MSEEKRVRTNAKQTSKGDWYFDVTTETEDVNSSVDNCIKAVKQLKEEFVKAGEKLVENEKKKNG